MKGQRLYKLMQCINEEGISVDNIITYTFILLTVLHWVQWKMTYYNQWKRIQMRMICQKRWMLNIYNCQDMEKHKRMTQRSRFVLSLCENGWHETTLPMLSNIFGPR